MSCTWWSDYRCVDLSPALSSAASCSINWCIVSNSYLFLWHDRDDVFKIAALVSSYLFQLPQQQNRIPVLIGSIAACSLHQMHIIDVYIVRHPLLRATNLLKSKAPAFSYLSLTSSSAALQSIRCMATKFITSIYQLHAVFVVVIYTLCHKMLERIFSREQHTVILYSWESPLHHMVIIS